MSGTGRFFLRMKNEGVGGKRKEGEKEEEKEKTDIRNLHCSTQQLDHITWKSAPVTAQQAAFVSS